MTLFAIPFPAVDPVLVEIGPVAIRWYALSYIVGIFLGWWYARTLVRNQAIWGPQGSPMKPADIDDFVVWCAVGIILGGRVGYVLFYDFPRFVENPLEIFALSTMEEPEVNEYPDSDKLYVMAGSPPGGDPAERIVDAAFRRADAVAYEEGER